MTARRIESDWFTIDAGRTRAYAELTNDFNPIHLDADFAAATPLGRPIAHGTLGLAHLMRLLQGSMGARAVSDGELKIRFRAPVWVDTRARAVIEPGAEEDGPLDLSLECEDGSIAISGTFTPRAAGVEGDRA